jgi:hypothetical protein
MLKVAVLAAFLLAFAAIGIGCLFNPVWGMKRMQMSAAGLIFAAFALYLLYVLLLK